MDEAVSQESLALALAVGALVAVVLADQVELSLLEAVGLGVGAGLLTVTWAIGGHQA